MPIAFGVFAFLILSLLANAIRVLREYERGVVFRLGRYVGTRGPGLVFLIPFVDRGVKVDMREIVLDEPAQSSITKDNALVDIDFVVYMRVIDAVYRAAGLEPRSGV